MGVSAVSLRPEEAVRLDLGVVVELLEGGKPGSAVVLGTATALLIAKMLAGVGGEETWGNNILDECANRVILTATHRRALHSRSCASSWTGCRDPGTALPGQTNQVSARWRCSRAGKSAQIPKYDLGWFTLGR